MADPILDMRELIEGDPLGYLSQNDRNLVMARLMFPRLRSGDNTGVNDPAEPTTANPSGVASVARGDMFLVSSTPTASSVFDGYANKLAVAMSDTPTSSQGYTFITPTEAARIQDEAGVNYIYDGSNWDTWTAS